MTRNDTPCNLEWSIRPRSGTDSAQCDWGIRILLYATSYINAQYIPLTYKTCLLSLAVLIEVPKSILCKDKWRQN